MPFKCGITKRMLINRPKIHKLQLVFGKLFGNDDCNDTFENLKIVTNDESDN